MTRTTTFIRAGTLFAMVGLSARWETPTSNPTPAPTPATPSATIAATGSGSIVIDPSIDARFGAALETPLRLIESAGGTADWNFARFQLYLGNREVERNEIGSDAIRAAGSRVGASSNRVVTAVFRINSEDFDRIDITLGFADLKDARQFTVPVAFSTFSDVTVSFVPMSRRLAAAADAGQRARERRAGGRRLVTGPRLWRTADGLQVASPPGGRDAEKRFRATARVRVLAGALALPPAWSAELAVREADFVVRDFRFASGEALPEVRLHYRTLGAPVRDAAGRRPQRRAAAPRHRRDGRAVPGRRSSRARCSARASRWTSAKHYVILPDARRTRRVEQAERRPAAAVPEVRLRRHGRAPAPAADGRAAA